MWCLWWPVALSIVVGVEINLLWECVGLHRGAYKTCPLCLFTYLEIIFAYFIGKVLFWLDTP